MHVQNRITKRGKIISINMQEEEIEIGGNNNNILLGKTTCFIKTTYALESKFYMPSEL